MEKILVPIDFSPAARQGFEYADHLSRSFQASLVVLHVFEKGNEQDQLEKLNRFVTPYPNVEKEQISLTRNVRCLCRKGKIVEVVNHVALELGLDLIVLGTRSKHDWWEYLFGSLSFQLIRHSVVPVLVVPMNSKVENIRKIVFAADLEMKAPGPLKEVKKVAQLLNASVEQVFVNLLPRDFSDQKEQTFRSDPEMKVTMIRDRSVSAGISYYIQKYGTDLLALYLPKRTKLEEVFHQSVTKQMAMQAPLPLLIFKEK